MNGIVAKLLSFVDGPIISRTVGAVVAALVGLVTAHVALDAGQTAQFQQALTTITTLFVYALTHNGIKGLSVATGNAVTPPAGTPAPSGPPSA